MHASSSMVDEPTNGQRRSSHGGCCGQVATWNLENLFWPDDGSDAEYEAKLRSLADTITSMAPDVVAVQEVGTPAALDDLVDLLDGTWHTALADPDSRGIRVGFLSRQPLTETDQVADFPPELAAVQVNDDGETVTMMGRPALRTRST